MLNSSPYDQKQLRFYSLLLVVGLLFFSSCMPLERSPSIENGSSTTSTTPSPNGAAYPNPAFPLSEIFVQEGVNQTSTFFSLPLNFTDSFLMRGESLSTYLRNVPNTTRFCLVSKFTYSVGSDKFLILSAKPKSFTDLVNKTTEFYLQVEPSNDPSNQNDCLTYNLTNSIFTNANSPTASFSLTQLCTNCNSSVTSEGFKLYFNNGEAVPALNLSLLALTISGSTSTTTNSCVESTACKARGFDCCLEGQCVTDGAIRPDAMTQPDFSTAQLDVVSNPTRFVLYPQFYFVCTTRPDSTGSTGSTTTVDPAYEASIRLMELSQLYQCLNKIDGEFSYCTAKFTSASQKISLASPFSSAEKGFNDDINFQNLNPNFSSGDYAHNITKIFYGGQIIYEALKTPLAAADGVFMTAGNDDLVTAQSVKITKPLPANARDDNLYLTFRIDGSCEKLGANLARCSKSYIQSYTVVTSPAYHDNSKVFNLPVYADTSPASNIIVKVSGVVVPEDPTTWTKLQSPNQIVFSASYPLYQNQVIDISYYVTSNVSSLVSAKTAAQTQVNNMCICTSNSKCNLRPIQDTNNNIINYECINATTTTNEPPINQTVAVSNKNVPHRYYDINGLNYDNSYATALDQEGIAFSYKNNDILKPTNLDAYTGYTGFNEIYGSFSQTNANAARAAKMVSVKKDKVYDLFASNGVFSTCLTCGSDYYSSILKVFPQNFTGMGGGYSPDNFASKRITTSGTYRGDDLLFGRACFIPATMIPWTHTTAAQVKDQRRNRLAGQHFLFANGYNRDWYGFDYGSLIGSFDGVTWFSIGNQRRIKATSNKLFLAVNSYFGDLNVDSNFNLTISETTIYSPAMPDHDTETTGAECQKSHFCSNDNDCFRQLGYDYSCQNIGTITTNWPVTDASGMEIIGSNNKTLASIVGGSNGQSKRCVYRGRGAPCHTNLSLLGTTFNSSALPGLLTCSTNNMCQSVAGGYNNRFNDRISRFANTPLAQNSANASPTVSDLVGLGARILGRPYDFYGTKTIPGTSSISLSSNNLNAICIPGKNIVSSNRTYDLNSSSPTNRIDSSDKILGIGTTMSGNQNPKYLNSCPATDSLGVAIQQYDLALGDVNTINIVTTTQNLSTNLLDIPAITAQGIFSSTSASPITSVGYQRNACLRAPGASCFSDLDCAPSEVVANKIKTITLTGILNAAEKKYWEEDLVCGNPDFKYVSTGVLNTSTFNIKNNFCCREFGKTFTVFTQDNTSDHHWCDTTNNVKVAGLNTNINNYNRYSRVHTAYDKLTCNYSDISPTKSFALSLDAPTTTARYNQLATQFKTLDTVNSRTCCTKNWVRNFAAENGGGHKWAASKHQTIEKSVFRSLNWVPTVPSISIPPTNVTPYECQVSAYNDPSCEIRDFNPADTELYLKYFSAFELVGIPQAVLMSEDQLVKVNNGIDGAAPTPGLDQIDGTVRPHGSVNPLTGLTVTEDFVNSTPKNLYSGSNYNALQSQLKKVFSENEFNCCIPSGQQIPDYATADQCCTGNVSASGTKVCCLPEYTDLTVYLSRYVSSEGRGLPDSAYDPDTGYIKDPGIVEMLAAQKNLCCTGNFGRGVAIRRLPIPMTGDTWVNQSQYWTKRFVNYSNSIDNNGPIGGPFGSLYDAGAKWNNHVYCLPNSVTIPPE